MIIRIFLLFLGYLFLKSGLLWVALGVGLLVLGMAASVEFHAIVAAAITYGLLYLWNGM